MWQVDEFADEHEGRPAAVLADGSEPKPLVFGTGSRGEADTSTDWWDYDGTFGSPKAAQVQAACSCGWRGAYLYPIDWSRVGEGLPTPFLLDAGGPLGDFQLHLATIRSQTVPLPVRLQELLTLIDSEMEQLADSGALAALRAAAALERTVARTGATAAWNLQRARTPIADIATGLGISPRAARSRLLRHGA